MFENSTITTNRVHRTGKSSLQAMQLLDPVRHHSRLTNETVSGRLHWMLRKQGLSHSLGIGLCGVCLHCRLVVSMNATGKAFVECISVTQCIQWF